MRDFYRVPRLCGEPQEKTENVGTLDEVTRATAGACPYAPVQYQLLSKTVTSRCHIWISFQPLLYLDMRPWLAWNLIAQAKVEFTTSPRLPWNTQSSRLGLLSGGIAGTHHHISSYPLTVLQLEFKVGAFKPWHKFGNIG